MSLITIKKAFTFFFVNGGQRKRWC